VVQDRSRESSSPDGRRRLGSGKGHARWRLRGLPLASLGALVAIGVALSPLASAQQQPQQQEIGLLFAQTANRGTMTPIKGTPRFKLRLRGVNPQVVWFSDRPARQSGHIPVRDFVRSWAGFGFVEDPPNAALTLLHAADHQDTVVVALGRPDFKKKKDQIRYSARILDEATGNLSHLESDLDPRVNRRFRAPSLFIDDATARVVGGCPIQPHTRCPGAKLVGEDLQEADLRMADLSKADLSEANLSEANLSGGALLTSALLVRANLARADLSEANLFNTSLTAADLRGAHLRQADLTRANLSGADLNRADLVFADFRRADLTRANLSGANLSRANLFNANLSGANLSGAELRGAQFCGTRMPDGSTNNRGCAD
jgi:uncharacterized protein YjbI with pentapeptide repeats